MTERYPGPLQVAALIADLMDEAGLGTQFLTFHPIRVKGDFALKWELRVHVHGMRESIYVECYRNAKRPYVLAVGATSRGRVATRDEAAGKVMDLIAEWMRGD